jgi:hypothetical protein
LELIWPEFRKYFNEHADGPRDLTGQKILKAKDIRKPEKFHLN